MDAFDLSQQGIVHVNALSDDLINQIEDGSADGYALTLAQNRIAHVRDVGAIFRHVVQLDFSGNQLTTLDGIQTLRQLVGLNLSRNRIASLDPLVSLTKLAVLIASENNIEQIDALSSCVALKSVNVSSNNLTTWPSLGQLGVLESLDLSDNLLSSFPPMWPAKLFPGSLLHLSIARNQIHELCGIAALGSHLARLQSLNIDGNQAVINLLSSEGALETLYANAFASLSEVGDECTNPMGIRETLMMSRSTLQIMSRAIQSGDEGALIASLRNGMLPYEQVPQPAAVNNKPKPTDSSMSPAQPEAPFKVTELSHPQVSSLQETSSFNSTIPVHSTGASALSKADKMEMWKRIQDERQAQEQKEKDRIQNEMVTPKDPPATSSHDVSPPPAPTSTSTDSTRRQQPSMSRSPPPPPPPALQAPSTDLRSLQQRLPQQQTTSYHESRTLESKPTSRSAEKVRAALTEAAPIKSAPSDSLAAQVHSLQDQVSTLRKYIKVWIKREQMIRTSSAIRIQRFLRQRQARLKLSQRLAAKRHKRQLRYSFTHCSSHLLPQLLARTANEQLLILRHFHAQSVQRWVRGWLTRRRLFEWKRKYKAASMIKSAWKRFRAYRNHLMERYLPRWWAVCHRHGKRYHQQGSAADLSVRQDIPIYTQLRCLCDVHELQRSFVAQQQATMRLWEDMTSVRRFMDYHMTKAVVRIQSRWRGYLSRKTHQHSIRAKKSSNSSRMQQQLELQALEIHELREQVSSLHRLVQSMVVQPQTTASQALQMPIT